MRAGSMRFSTVPCSLSSTSRSRAKNSTAAWRRIASANDTVSLKVNTLGGRGISTNVDLVAAVCERLQQAGVPARNIIVWDRDTEEMERAVFASPSAAIACNASVQTAWATKTISPRGAAWAADFQRSLLAHRMCSLIWPVLKDHDGAGVTIALKKHVRCDPQSQQVPPQWL